MSLSLSSLLNPSPEAEHAPPPPRIDSLPPIQYVQSPERQQPGAASPQSAHRPPPAHQHSHPPNTEQDAVHALAALSGGGSGAPPPLQSQWYSAGAGAAASAHDRRSNSYEQRPGSSGYNEPVQLPPPSSTARHPSSPTLEQYQVASRSPDQRRPSMISPTQAGFTLPPIQRFNQSPSEYAARQLNAYEPPKFRPSTGDANHAASHAETASYRRDQTQEHSSASGIFRQSSPSAQPSNSTTIVKDPSSPPTAIKQEATPTPRVSSPLEPRRADGHTSEAETQSLKTIASLKNEHGLRTHSPLRESSVPMPSTEPPQSEPLPSKKRPAPSKTKKGTATTKKAPPAKKRKVEPIRSITPSSRASKPPILKPGGGSTISTPIGSSPAPSTRSHSDDAYEEPYPDDASDEDMLDDGDAADGDDDGDLYCICRRPDNGTFMIGCDGTCDDWFHGKCVGIEERDKNLIDKYVCPNCTSAGAGKTTWKRICRRSGCRQPARVGKTKGGKDGSKYCSEECGVLYFRGMVGRTRGREEEEVAKQHHPSRGHRSKVGGAVDRRRSIDYDLGARGGTLAAGELKSLINSSATADDFKKLGEGVLSPPATPDSKSSKERGEFTESEAQALHAIHRRKEESRRKHQLLKDRMKFVTMVKQAASRMATEKELKPKEYCGYDSRLEWTDEQFGRWRRSRGGKQAFELDTLSMEPSENANDEMEEDDELALTDCEICDRKKCARHLEWTKLAVDDVRFEMSDNSDRMRTLEKEEKELRERAALRAKAGSMNGEGRVEVHGLGISMNAEPGVDGSGVMETVEGRKGEEELATASAAA